MTPATVVQCPECAAQVSAGEQYCEACGAELAPAPAASADAADAASNPAGDLGQMQAEDQHSPQSASCHQCGGEVAEDGYCTMCGAKARSPRDHFTEQPATWVAAVCDRGIRHSRNEDAVALDARPEPGSHAVLVVCDGVSNSTDSDVASLAAARAARDTLACSSPSGIGTAGARVAATVQALGTAADAANDAVISHTVEGQGEPASCTFVAAVLDASVLVVGWVGDSRAYWLPDDGEALMLTVDDSFASEQIAAGVARKVAETGPQAHAITRWLGIDAPDHTPHTRTLDLTAPGWVLVCSDGLWNYCSEPHDLSSLVQEQAGGPSADPLELAAALVDWANMQGGADNITAALARIDRSEHRKEGTNDGNVLS